MIKKREHNAVAYIPAHAIMHGTSSMQVPLVHRVSDCRIMRKDLDLHVNHPTNVQVVQTFRSKSKVQTHFDRGCRNLASAEANAVSLFDAMVAAE